MKSKRSLILRINSGHVEEDDWEYFRIPEHINAAFLPDGNGNVEYVVAVRISNLITQTDDLCYIYFRAIRVFGHA